MTNVCIGEYPRLFRYREKRAMPLPDTLLAMYDADQNLVIINRYLFDLLDDQDKNRVLRTNCSLMFEHGRIVEHRPAPVAFPADDEDRSIGGWVNEGIRWEHVMAGLSHEQDQ